MQESAILMMLNRQLSFLMMSFKWRHVNLSGPGADESLYLLIADLNSVLENGLHHWDGLCFTLFRVLGSTWQYKAVLKELWSEFHKLSGVRHGRPSCLIASVAGSFLFLTQFISSYRPQLLFVISWILLSKKVRLASLTVFLNDFQFSQLLVVL